MSRTESVSREWTSIAPFELRRTLKEEFDRVALPELSHLYTAASYLTRERAEAEDLVQETYLRAFRFFDRFEPGTNCRGWLRSILRKLFINRYQQRRREPEPVDWENGDPTTTAAQGENLDPEALFLLKSMDDEVTTALMELPNEYRTAIVFVAIEELTYEEAARVMGCPIGTVRSRVSRAIGLLQVALRDYALKRGYTDPYREQRAV